MIRYLLYTLAILVLFSCKEEETWEITMPDDKIIAVIEDLHIARALVTKYPLEQRDSMIQVLRIEVAAIHKVSPEELDVIIETVQNSPKKYLEMEKMAVKNLTSRKDSLKKSQTAKNIERDKKSKTLQLPKKR